MFCFSFFWTHANWHGQKQNICNMYHKQMNNRVLQSEAMTEIWNHIVVQDGKSRSRRLHYFCRVRADCSVPCYRSFAFAVAVKDESALPFVLPPSLPIALTCAPRGSVQHDCGRGSRLLRQVIVCLRMSGVTHLCTIILSHIFKEYNISNCYVQLSEHMMSISKSELTRGWNLCFCTWRPAQRGLDRMSEIVAVRGWDSNYIWVQNFLYCSLSNRKWLLSFIFVPLSMWWHYQCNHCHCYWQPDSGMYYYLFNIFHQWNAPGKYPETRARHR